MRTINLPPLTLHHTWRYWSELTTEQRQAGIRLGYSAAMWDQQVRKFAPSVLRKTQNKDNSAKEAGKNPLVKW